MIRGGLGAALGLIALAVGACRSSSQDPSDGASQPIDCARCHAEIDAAWRTSLHARAWTDPIFQAEYAGNPAPSCRGCHAPSAAVDPDRGVDCAACHVRDGLVVAASPTWRGALAHPVRPASPADQVDTCASCHQFDFTDDGIHDGRDPLQDTVHEWQRSNVGPQAGQAMRSCTSCHMPRTRDNGRVHIDHTLRGLDDTTLVAKAVKVEGHAERTAGAVAVDVTIRGDRIGHAFPTGDVFRVAVLELRVGDGSPVQIDLQRHFALTLDDDGADHHVRQVDDTRVPPPGVGVLQERVLLPSGSGDRVSWTLRLYRLPPATARARGLDDHVAGQLVAQGSIPIAAPAG